MRDDDDSSSMCFNCTKGYSYQEYTISNVNNFCEQHKDVLNVTSVNFVLVLRSYV